MADAPIKVEVDNRIRLLAAVLSMTTWPFQEQDQHKHDVHAHAKATQAHLKDDEHAAVETMQDLMESAYRLDDIFVFANYLKWPNLRIRGEEPPDWFPEDWATQLRDFTHGSRIKELWDRDHRVWEAAEEESAEALAVGDPIGFLSRFFGDLSGVELVFQPNLCFPSDRTLGFWRDRQIVCVCPPRIAWGHNPPWPYNDDPAATLADAMTTYSRVLLDDVVLGHPDLDEARQESLPVPNTFRSRYPDWVDQFRVLLTNGMTIMYLEETLGHAESAAVMMMVQKAHSMDVMPSVIDVLNRYLEGYEAGKYASFAEYFPTFPRALNLAESMRNV